MLKYTKSKEKAQFIFLSTCVDVSSWAPFWKLGWKISTKSEKIFPLQCHLFISSRWNAIYWRKKTLSLQYGMCKHLCQKENKHLSISLHSLSIVLTMHFSKNTILKNAVFWQRKTCTSVHTNDGECEYFTCICTVVILRNSMSHSTAYFVLQTVRKETNLHEKVTSLRNKRTMLKFKVLNFTNPHLPLQFGPLWFSPSDFVVTQNKVVISRNSMWHGMAYFRYEPERKETKWHEKRNKRIMLKFRVLNFYKSSSSPPLWPPLILPLRLRCYAK